MLGNRQLILVIQQNLLNVKFCQTLKLSSNIFQLQLFSQWQGSTYLFEVLSWTFIISQPYSDQRRKHILVQQIFLAHRTIYFSQLLETNLLPETTVSQTQPTFICSNSTILTVE